MSFNKDRKSKSDSCLPSFHLRAELSAQRSGAIKSNISNTFPFQQRGRSAFSSSDELSSRPFPGGFGNGNSGNRIQASNNFSHAAASKALSCNSDITTKIALPSGNDYGNKLNMPGSAKINELSTGNKGYGPRIEGVSRSVTLSDSIKPGMRDGHTTEGSESFGISSASSLSQLKSPGTSKSSNDNMVDSMGAFSAKQKLGSMKPKVGSECNFMSLTSQLQSETDKLRSWKIQTEANLKAKDVQLFVAKAKQKEMNIMSATELTESFDKLRLITEEERTQRQQQLEEQRVKSEETQIQLPSKLSDLSNQYDKLIKSSSCKSSSKDDHLNSMRSCLTDKEQQINLISFDLHKSERDCSNLRAELSKAESQVSQLKSKKEEQESRIRSVCDETDTLKFVKVTLEHRLSAQEHELERVEHALESLEQEKKSLEQLLSSMTNNLELIVRDNESLRHDVKELGRERESSESECNVMKRDCHSLKQSCSELKRERGSVRAEVGSLRADKQSLEQESSSLSRCMEELKSKIRAVEEQRDNKIEEYGALRIELSTAHEQLNELMSTLDSVRQALEERNKELSTLQDEEDEMRRLLGDRDKEIGDLKRSLEERDEEIKFERIKFDNLLKQEISTKSNLQQITEGRIAELEAELNAKKDSIGELNERLKDQCKTEQDSKTTIAAVTSDLKVARDQCCSYQPDTEELSRIIEAHRRWLNLSANERLKRSLRPCLCTRYSVSVLNFTTRENSGVMSIPVDYGTKQVLVEGFDPWTEVSAAGRTGNIDNSDSISSVKTLYDELVAQFKKSESIRLSVINTLKSACTDYSLLKAYVNSYMYIKHLHAIFLELKHSLNPFSGFVSRMVGWMGEDLEEVEVESLVSITMKVGSNLIHTVMEHFYRLLMVVKFFRQANKISSVKQKEDWVERRVSQKFLSVAVENNSSRYLQHAAQCFYDVCRSFTMRRAQPELLQLLCTLYMADGKTCIREYQMRPVSDEIGRLRHMSGSVDQPLALTHRNGRYPLAHIILRKGRVIRVIARLLQEEEEEDIKNSNNNNQNIENREGRKRKSAVVDLHVHKKPAINPCSIVCQCDKTKLPRHKNLSAQKEAFLKDKIRGLDSEFTTEQHVCHTVVTNGLGELLLNLHLGPHHGCSESNWAGRQVAPKEHWVSYEEARMKIINELKGHTLVGHAVQGDLEKMEIIFPDSRIRDTATYRPLIDDIAPSRKPNEKIGLSIALLHFGFKVQQEAHCALEDTVSSLYLYIQYSDRWEQELKNKEYESYLTLPPPNPGFISDLEFRKLFGMDPPPPMPKPEYNDVAEDYFDSSYYYADSDLSDEE